MAQTTCHVVWALFPLCEPPFPSSSAFIGCCGPLWAFMAVVCAKEGRGGRLSCTVKKNTGSGVVDFNPKSRLVRLLQSSSVKSGETMPCESRSYLYDILF